MRKTILSIAVCLIISACDGKDSNANANANPANNAMNIASENVIDAGTAPAAEVAVNVVAAQGAPATAASTAASESPKAIEDIQKSNSNVEDDYAAWLHQVALPSLQNKCAQKGIDLSLPECGQHALFYGDGPIMLPPEDPNWANARALAYDKALIRAYQKAAEYLSLSTQTSMVQELFVDSERPTLGNDMKSNLNILFDKVIALAEGHLDSKLIELGINPAQFNGASDSVKKTMLKDAITKQSVKSAIANTTGMIPYQTFEGKDQNGNHVIRVVVSIEPDRIALVKTMLSKQAQVMPNADKKSQKSLYERLVLDRAILANQFGTRLMYDEHGYPVLVAFGQAGVEKAATRSGTAARAEIAQRKAVAHADAVLTLLLNSTTSSKEITKEVLQHLEEEKLVSDKTSDTIMDELSESDSYNDYMDSKTSVSGHIENFSGRSEFYNWTYELPTSKQKIAGVILVWSPQTARHAQNIKAGKSSTGAIVPTSSGNIEQVPTNVIRGIESDF